MQHLAHKCPLFGFMWGIISIVLQQFELECIFYYYRHPWDMSAKKTDYLRKTRTLNPHPEAVSDPRFDHHPFFDPKDLLQVRYEMVRAHKKDTTLKEVASRFGMSVPTCVRLKRLFRQGGLQALIPGQRGAKGPRKVTPEVLEFIQQYQIEYGEVSVRKLAEVVSKHFKVTIHFSSLHRALSKKNAQKHG